MDPPQLESLARELPGADARRVHAYLDSLAARQRSDLAGVRDRLAILAESEVGPLARAACAPRRALDLLAPIARARVVYFSLESDRRPLLAEMLGAAIVQDLQTVVAALQSQPVPTLVVIDEFSAIASRAGRAAVRPRPLGRVQPAARDPGARGPARARSRAAARAGARQRRGADRAPPERAGLGRADREHRRQAAHMAHLPPQRRPQDPHEDARGVLDKSQIMDLDSGWTAVIALDGSGEALDHARACAGHLWLSAEHAPSSARAWFAR